ncbi:unnamed protein product [Polarella glacialis]|uniref:Uncharacterized protein n=1 Tax=Polarella glacialis TaxID=89957 RepID=A0A813KV57_POLGL|nr:unnamed protein product [Polarella glacialis]
MGADVCGNRHKEVLLGWGPIVVIGRDGMEDSLQETLREIDGQNQVFYVEQFAGKFSSTRLREALLRGDAKAAHELCPGAVAEYLLARPLSDLYGELAPQVAQVASSEQASETRTSKRKRQCAIQ